MLGAGHGGLESIAVGLVALAGLVGYLVVALLPAESFGGAAPQIEAARKQFAQMQGWEPLLGAERQVVAFGVQVAERRGNEHTDRAPGSGHGFIHPAAP
jgi:hypothetical protein